MKQMRNKLFRSTAAGMTPKESAVAIAHEEYLLAGELCASTICQGRPAPNFLSEWVYDFLVGGLHNIQFPSTTDLNDEKLNDFVYKVTKFLQEFKFKFKFNLNSNSTTTTSTNNNIQQHGNNTM